MRQDFAAQMTSLDAARLPAGTAPARPATDPVEATLADLWRRHFRSVGITGDSRLLDGAVGLRRVMRFVRDAEAALGARIPPIGLLHLGTVNAVSAAIATQRWPDPSPRILLRDGSADCTLYVLATGDGVILSLCQLAALIDFPGQIWGLQLPGLDGESAPLTSIADIARHFVDALPARGPRSAYQFVGYSFGGLVAVEMARLLQARGQPVGLVGLLDTNCYQKYWPKSAWLGFALRRAGRRLLELRAMPRRAAARQLIAKLAAALSLLRRRLAKSPAGASPSRSIYYVGGLDPDFQRVRDASIVAYEAHDPQPVDCPIVLFKSALGEARACDPAGIWRRLTRTLEVVAVPGSHTTMLRKPFAQTLAAEISRRLVHGPA
jgi:thioesterase domain-containing protein